ncbi:MAG: T9SS type A sorting domain-containing protein [Candidatus Marinimicrobia bacterium]|jgi:hypothetical protein|nr:T9SS type A sorting domain-containing protein [Candidatus Neomarinimicrobiota bacterium]MBT3635078.1 T9SS type A sorting domain-containing protein [Candidatus Neomarinimicrobiota bacterium]MBT3683116.1 T9SS type A sorting domain-containing protein [Candidatus Neomarinimicrobiota bacterium]MBT3760722.1 T9SS type A sorting domain-containing protein [Candidatus Neomarinimicrobiota bacterium]MBT3896822.1 T9SS type A sorting domain-containing protein [Candidatus Neomarinimicrobiota bacterium]
MKYLFTLLTGISMIFSATINVPADQATIQDGINAASNGDVVLVAPGTYVENIDFNGKNITVTSTYDPVTDLSGSLIETTIIDGNNDGSAVVLNSGEDNTAVLFGFTIINGYAFNGGGIYVHGADPTFQYLIIAENNAYFSGAGVYCLNATTSFSNVTIANNEAGDFAGAIDRVNSTVTITNSILWDNLPNSLASNFLNVSYSTIESPEDSVYTGTGNLNEDPLFEDSTAPVFDYYLQGASPCIDAGNGFDFYVTNFEMGALVFGPTTGCMDNTAYNYDAGATVPATCQYQPVANNVSETVSEDNAQVISFDATDGNGGDVLTYSVVIDSINQGTIVMADPTSGDFIYTPDPDFSGFGFISYTVTDDSNFLMPDGSNAGLLEDSAIITINVTPVNDPPILAPIGNINMTFNEPYNLTINVTDPDNLSFGILAETTSSFLDLNTDNLPLVVITPTNFWGGTGDVTITVNDASGATDSETFTVTHMPTGEFATFSFGSLDYSNHVIPIMMDNPMPIAGFEFQVSPEVITLASVYGGRASDLGWISNIDLQSNIVLGFMTTNLPPIPPAAPGDTALTFLSWNQGEWSGGPEICIENIILSDTLAQNVVAVIGSCVTYPYTSDVNQDASIDVLDIVEVVNFIFGTVPNAFQLWAADSNEDELVNVIDVVYIVQVILGIIVPRDDPLSSSEIYFENNQFMVKNPGSIAGIEVDYSGQLTITNNYLPENWEVHQTNNKLLIFNFGDETLSSDHLFDFDGNFEITSNILAGYNGNSISAEVIGLPLTYSLNPAYPNPFNPVTNINYSIQNGTDVQIVIYDILGNQVDLLVNDFQTAGNYAVNWDASEFASGVYLVKMSASNFVQTQKLILLK